MVTRIRPLRSRIPILGTAILVVLAFSAFAASAVQAKEWRIGSSSMTKLGLTEEATAGTGSGLTITSTALGTPLKFTCAETSSGKAIRGGTGETTLSLSGCAVSEPANCTAAPFTLNAKTELVTIGGVNYEKFLPKEGTTFGNVTLSNCAQAETYAVRGSFAGKAEAGGKLLLEQPVELSKAAAEAVGTSLTLGGKAATATAGTLKQSLNGAKKGTTWGPNKGAIWGSTAAGSEWQVEGSTLSKLGIAQEPIAGKGASVTFAGTFWFTPVKWSCGVSSSGALLPGGKVEGMVFKFSGCTVQEPVGCGVNSFQTVALSGSGSTAAIALKPAGGLTSVTFTGCALAETYPLSGSISGTGEANGTQLIEQPLALSSSLSFGKNPISLTGTMNNYLPER